MRRPTSALTLALLLAIGSVAGCVTDGPVIVEPPKKRPQPQLPSAAPMKMMVSPLTRVGFDSVGNPSLMVHLDFRDDAQQSVKAFGRLRVELYEPVTPGAAAPAAPVIAQSWDADLRDPVRNALSYDEMITRTYTVTLTAIPDWLQKWAKKDAAPTAKPTGPAPTIVVQYLNGNDTGNEKILRVPYTLTR